MPTATAPTWAAGSHGLSPPKRSTNRIVIRCHPENGRSSAVAKRLGFSYEGTLRECAKHNGELHDLEVYSVLRREWSDSSSA